MPIKMRIKKGDSVIVIAGKDKGKTGLVQDVMPKQNKLIVEGVNLKRKKPRPNPKDGYAAPRTFVEFAIHASNVAYVDVQSGLPTRIGYKIVDGKKVRFAKKSGELIDASIN